MEAVRFPNIVPDFSVGVFYITEYPKHQNGSCYISKHLTRAYCTSVTHYRGTTATGRTILGFKKLYQTSLWTCYTLHGNQNTRMEAAGFPNTLPELTVLVLHITEKP
jgi:hypothetical protein